MKKFEFGMFALCVLIGSYFGSLFGIAVAVCAFMTVDGLVEEVVKNSKKKEKVERKEIK